ncbi:phage baseplate assembly protein V [Crassaminicella profunda]|uniref:phage baseplate assembly protein V n=1 Tax=Crassaminicella profunda TaxID=1286698 RepID=UPI001CA7069A|nr:phage baseplate assembly protein V [Crassaminicella profunda]QZY54472.1 phage baseplate assembly protein V [Crassaminicella profunda]
MSIYDLLDNEKKEYNPIAYGVTIGIVTNNKDPDKLGRVKVRLLNRDMDNYETDWIRIVTLMAGKKMGTFFLPEVNDEVLIAFGEGNIHKPYVIGALWNGKDSPPVTNEDGKNNIRKIKTRNGSEIIFNDEENKESIEIHTPKKQSILMDDEKEMIKIYDKNKKNLLEIDIKKGQIHIKGDKKIIVESGSTNIEMNGSSNNIKIESSTSLKIKSQKIDMEASGPMKIKAASLNIQSDATCNIKGAIVKIN